MTKHANFVLIVPNGQELHQTLRQNIHEPSNLDHLADRGIKDQYVSRPKGNCPRLPISPSQILLPQCRTQNDRLLRDFSGDIRDTALFFPWSSGHFLRKNLPFIYAFFA